MSITRHRNEWLSLVPNSGPFLSLPVLAQAFSSGLEKPEDEAEVRRRLRMAFDEWDDDRSSPRPDPGIHRAWIKLVLSETLGYDDLLAEGQAIPQTLKSEVAEYGETLRPDWIVNDPATKKARLLVQVYPRSQSLTKPVASSRWKTSPDTRMMQLLHDTGIRLGIVTNGDHWMLVNAPKNETTGYVSWYANLWLEEPITLRAFRTLLCADRFFSVQESETLEALLDKSANDQQEVTTQLGYQVRKAVEVLIQALDKADQDHGRKLLADVDEKVLYESALTVMMRLVFLFSAEERELLLLGDDLYDKNYAVSTLREQLRVTADQFGEEILGLRYDAWTRLLTSFRAVYAGARHDRLRIPAYGGSLFNPDRFPFLEGRKAGTSWKNTEATPLPVSNRTVLHLLEALQVLQVRLPGGGAAEARKLSFRSLDIEQIGHVYEGLLDHTAKRSAEPVLGLQGTRDKEPEIALAELEKIAAKSEKEVLKFLKDETGRSESALKKGLKAELDEQLVSRFRTACQDSELWKRVKPFAGLVRLDTVGYPVVITPGSVFVTGGTDRRSSGTHYTPKSLTEPIVQYTLEPLVYVGPAEGLPREEWKLRSAKELLDLKICDMACGSGAFLVQACRYMSERLLEAWDAAEKTAQVGHQDMLFEKKPRTATVVRITPYGMSSEGRLYEQVIPLDPDERQTYALRIVAQRCLYGVDKNPLAVEMAKLSLWLLTLAKDKPFEFLDHAIRCGDSLVGIHNIEQLRKFNLDGKGEDNNLFLQFLDPRIKEAIALRRQITEMQANTVEEVEAQDRLLREANEKIDRLKCAADLLIAAEFVPGSAADKRGARDDAAIKVAVHFNDSDLPTFRSEALKGLAGQATFHWPLEFPEVMVERGGFDAFVGNPPFAGKNGILANCGTAFLTFIQRSFEDTHGYSDFCTYFLRRSYSLIRQGGLAGLIGTTSLSEGKARESGLGWLCSHGGTIIFAMSEVRWPGQASVSVCVPILFKGTWLNLCTLDGMLSPSISSTLEAFAESEPHSLSANKPLSTTGFLTYGRGFVLTKGEASALCEADPISKEVIFPLLSIDDLLYDVYQAPSQYLINFGDRDEGDARLYRACFAWVEEHVKSERMACSRDDAKKYWWRLVGRAATFFATVARHGLKRILVNAHLSKHLVFVFASPAIAFEKNVNMFAFDDYSVFSALQSSIHLAWADYRSSSLETRRRYTTTTCFDSFPLPLLQTNTGYTTADGSSLQMTLGDMQRVAEVGREYSKFRHAVMERTASGLTDTYNGFHTPDETSADIQKLRQLHVEMDNAVAVAYGWTDLDLGHSFHETKQGVRYTISEPARREVLARLLKLNHERYAEEGKQGLHEKKKTKATKKTKKVDETADLFGGADD